MRAISVKGHGGGAREVRSRVQGRRGAVGTRHLPGLRCCNRAATGAGRTSTEQENDVVRNARNRLYERCPRQSSTHPESVDLTYKEEVAGSSPASPTSKKWVFAGKTSR